MRRVISRALRAASRARAASINFETMDLSIFTDMANYDYHLSTAISQITDAGIILADAGDDYDCHSRTIDGMPDIGADEFNSILSSIFSPLKYSALDVYPNPAAEKITLNLTSFCISILNISITDSLGRILYSEATNIDDKNTSLDISISHFPPGIYHLVVSDKKSVFSKTITKL